MILVCNDYDSLYSKFWGNLGEVTRDTSLLFTDPDRIKLICFTGGEDVSPELYGHRNLGSHSSLARDEEEMEIFAAAKENGVPQTGICRGAQFLNVMAGGTMSQHIRKSHGGGNHTCQTFDGREFPVTSSHHQMIVPGPGGQVLAWAAMRLHPEDFVYDGELPKSVMDPEQPGMVRITEAIYYPRLKIYAQQWHPEWMDFDSEAARWSIKRTRRFCWNEKEMSSAV